MYNNAKLATRFFAEKWRIFMSIKPELLEVLACPKCKGEIRISKDEKSIVCDSCKLVFEIREDIPVMLIDEAQQVEDTSGY